MGRGLGFCPRVSIGKRAERMERQSSGDIMRVNGAAVGIVVALTFTLCGAGLAYAQSVAPPPAVLPVPSPQASVHVTTRVVQVTVSVQDREGRPVTGLTKDDFVVMDEGQRQQITSFSEQTNHVTTTAVPANVFT